MRAVDRWGEIEDNLDADWTSARLSFVPEGDTAAAAAILAPIQPGRVGDELRIHVTRAGSGAERLRHLLARLDERRVWGTLTLTGVDSEAPPAKPEAVEPATLVDAWDAAVRELPPGWSDLLCELELDSSDHLPRAALLGSPVNPTRSADVVGLRFRVSGKAGYGASPAMVRRCFERMDAEGLTGTVTVLHGLSDTENAVTQGPVWRLAGRSV